MVKKKQNKQDWGLAGVGKRSEAYAGGRAGGHSVGRVGKHSAGRGRGVNTVVIRGVIVGVIVLAIVAVVVAVVGRFLLNDEKIAKDKLETYAREYYEGYVYENLINGAMGQDEINEVMSKYEVRGFAPVKMRQLLLYDGQERMAESEVLLKHCDENLTEVKYYPEEPFKKKSYRMEFQYDCDF